MDSILRIVRGFLPVLPSVIRPGPSLARLQRCMCSNTHDIVANTNAEKKLVDILKKRFPTSHVIQVADVSGGCGAMYDVTVITSEFKDLSIVKQHRMVTEALKEEIKQMHGLRISTHHEPFSEDNK